MENKIFEKATSSPEGALQFIVDTQYDSILERAIGAKVVNSDVGREALFNVLVDLVQANDINMFNYLLGGEVTYDGLTQDVQDTLKWACEKAKTPALQRKMQQTEGASGSGWTSDNTNAALEAFAALAGGFLSLFGNNEPAPSGGGSGSGSGTTAPAPSGGQSSSWVPWAIGIGIAVLIVTVIVVLVRKK
jgi:hypothetical protein